MILNFMVLCVSVSWVPPSGLKKHKTAWAKRTKRSWDPLFRVCRLSGKRLGGGFKKAANDRLTSGKNGSHHVLCIKHSCVTVHAAYDRSSPLPRDEQCYRLWSARGPPLNAAVPSFITIHSISPNHVIIHICLRRHNTCCGLRVPTAHFHYNAEEVAEEPDPRVWSARTAGTSFSSTDFLSCTTVWITHASPWVVKEEIEQ